MYNKCDINMVNIGLALIKRRGMGLNVCRQYVLCMYSCLPIAVCIGLPRY